MTRLTGDALEHHLESMLATRSFPPPPEQKLGRNLVTGSILFGMGWGLVGLCPGPAMASLSFGGPGVWIFGIAMLAGMLAAPHVRMRLDALGAGA